MNFAIIGFGGLGKLHFRCAGEVANRVKDVKLVAICDIDEQAFHTQTSTNLGNVDDELDLSEYHLYTCVDELLKNERLDFVITALPTYIHEEIAVKVMKHGINVFSEKPMALTLEQGEHMLQVAKESQVKLMIGQCVRYFPEYAMLKNLIDSKKYGKVIRADFIRISPNITWSWQDWMLDGAKSGGAALDMHVHDVDFIQWAFGVPKAVTSVATNHKTEHESISTVYHYDDMLVTGTGDWGMPGCFPFTPGFTVRFEKATVVMSAAGVKLYPEEGEPSDIEVQVVSGYIEEIVDFIQCIREDRESKINPPEASCCTLKIALAEKQSADTNQTVYLS
ncbi:MAG: Gfo/Idh/MocA family oxidoreductase [Tyzzerella sp.]|nr:Gfo/Idh/MocA family oxidoreductase [Tyzzerella sp.]